MSAKSSTTKEILVLGGNGKTGSRIVRKLADLGIPVRGVSRSTTPAFDWDDPSTWAKCLEGISSVYISYQPDLAVPEAVAAIKHFTAQANIAGVKKMVLLSGRGEEEAQRCEEILKENANDWTIVRASWFNQNFNEGNFLESVKAGFVELPADKVLEPFIDADDIADVAVAALTQEGHSNKLYEVTGPRLLTFREAVDEISKASGREIQYFAVTVDAYKSSLEGYGVPAPYINFIGYLFTEVLDGRNQSVANGVYEALGRPAKDFSTFAAEAAKTGIWNS